MTGCDLWIEIAFGYIPLDLMCLTIGAVRLMQRIIPKKRFYVSSWKLIFCCLSQFYMWSSSLQKFQISDAGTKSNKNIGWKKFIFALANLQSH